MAGRADALPPGRIATARRRVVVVGAGLSGLIVAYRRSLAGDEVTLLEASPRIGGQLWTEVADGFVVEHGAEGFSSGSETVRRLARELGLEQELVEQSVHRSYCLDERGLVLLDPGEAPARLGLGTAASRQGRGIAAFRAGVGQFAEALARAVRRRGEIRLNQPVRRLTAPGPLWKLETEASDALYAESVVLAMPAHAAGALLAPLSGGSTGLERAPAHSSVSVSLSYARTAVPHALDGTGFVVSDPSSFENCRACTFSSSKLPGRSPPGFALLRCFFRPARDELESLTDEAWRARAERVLERALGVKEAPLRSFLARWPHALAVENAEQARCLARVERRFAGSGLLLAGAAFRGAGIEGAVRSGEIAAAAILDVRRAS